jgi:hypothetical protein
MALSLPRIGMPATRLRCGGQVIGRKAHPPATLNDWVGCQNEAVCESSCLPDNLGFPIAHPLDEFAQLTANSGPVPGRPRDFQRQ